VVKEHYIRNQLREFITIIKGYKGQPFSIPNIAKEWNVKYNTAKRYTSNFYHYNFLIDIPNADVKDLHGNTRYYFFVNKDAWSNRNDDNIIDEIMKKTGGHIRDLGIPVPKDVNKKVYYSFIQGDYLLDRDNSQYKVSEPQFFRDEGPLWIDFEKKVVPIPNIAEEVLEKLKEREGIMYLIEGPPASGKSFITRYLTYKFSLDNSFKIYILDFIDNPNEIIVVNNLQKMTKDQKIVVVFENIHYDMNLFLSIIQHISQFGDRRKFRLLCTKRLSKVDTPNYDHLKFFHEIKELSSRDIGEKIISEYEKTHGKSKLSIELLKHLNEIDVIELCLRLKHKKPLEFPLTDLIKKYYLDKIANGKRYRNLADVKEILLVVAATWSAELSCPNTFITDILHFSKETCNTLIEYGDLYETKEMLKLPSHPRISEELVICGNNNPRLVDRIQRELQVQYGKSYKHSVIRSIISVDGWWEKSRYFFYLSTHHRYENICFEDNELRQIAFELQNESLTNVLEMILLLIISNDDDIPRRLVTFIDFNKLIKNSIKKIRRDEIIIPLFSLDMVYNRREENECYGNVISQILNNIDLQYFIKDIRRLSQYPYVIAITNTLRLLAIHSPQLFNDVAKTIPPKKLMSLFLAQKTNRLKIVGFFKHVSLMSYYNKPEYLKMALNMYDLTFFAKIIQSYSDFNPLELYLFVYTFASCDKEKTKIFVNSLSIKWIQTVTNKEKINHDDKRSKNMLEIIDKLKEILKFFVEIP